MGTDCQKVSGHHVAILHEKLGWGSVMVWWVGLPKIIDLAKIGLANDQPGSDTKSVTTGFSGYQFLERDRRAHQPRDYC